MSKEMEVVGKKFGKLYVLCESKKENKYFYSCKCECGNITTVEKYNLISGHTTSCGCKIKNPQYEKIIGKKFGKLVVVKEINCFDKNGHKHFLCKCECGNFCEVLGGNLLHNQTRSCGCLSNIKPLMRKTSIINKSGVKGVYFDNHLNKWVAKLTIDKKTYKSYHDIFDEAKIARKLMEQKYHMPIIEKYS